MQPAMTLLMSLAQVGAAGNQQSPQCNSCNMQLRSRSAAICPCPALHVTGSRPCSPHCPTLQLNGGVLDDQQALRLVNGLAGPVPLPRMQGMSVPRGIDLPTHLLPPGTPGAAAPQPGAVVPQRPPPPSPAAAQPSPARPAPAMPPAGVPPTAAGAVFPPLSGEQAAAYQTAFSQLDTDRDGFVQVGSVRNLV